MEPVARLKRSVRKLSGCVWGTEERGICAKRRVRRGRGGCNRSRRPKDPSGGRSYQADLDKERKLREAMNAQKNAERAAVRAHFRRKYQLAENPKDSEHLRSVGGKVSLPRELSRMIYPQARGKDGGFNLLSAFQGLGFGAAAPAGRRPDKPAAAAPSDADSCSVM